jgi:type I restriction enzyme, S subunit
MANGWQTVQLGDVLRRVKSELAIDDSVTYKQVTVRLWNKGVVLRGEQEGSDIKTKRQFYVKTGQLLMSRIDVRNGAIGLVPKELDGAIVSNDFWVYDFDKNQIHPEFLAHYVKTPGFIEDANRTSSGTTKRIRAEETAFLNINIPLPPLEEQRRIVAHIESLAARVHEAQRLREETDVEAHTLLDAALIQLFENSKATKKSLRDVSEFQRGRFSWRPRNDPRFYDGDYPFIQIGDIPRDNKLIKNHTQTLNEDGLKVSRMFPTGTIVISIAATIGAVGILDFDSCMPDSLVGLNAKPEMAISDYLYYFLKYSQSHFERIAPQSAQKNINIGILESVNLPVPPLDEQRRIVAYLDGLQAKVNALRELQVESGKELSALMPSVLDKAFKGEL